MNAEETDSLSTVPSDGHPEDMSGTFGLVFKKTIHILH